VPLRQKTRLFSAGVRALAVLVIAFAMHFFVVLLQIIIVVMIDKLVIHCISFFFLWHCSRKNQFER
jgi:hypothetical protein